MNVFSAPSADLAWRQAADVVIRRSGTHVVGSRNGQAVELVHATVSIDNPRARWVASRLPAMNIALAIAEVVQIIAGGNDVRFLEHFYPGYGKYVGRQAVAAGAYGERLRGRWGFDQLARAAESLIANGESRQVVLSIWDARADLPIEGGQPRSGDVPCNVLSCLRLVGDRLHWLQTCRSNDLFRGLPFNVVQFTCLQEVVAGWIGADLGRYSHVISSLHGYVESFDAFRIDPSVPTVAQSNDIRLPRADAEVAWRRLFDLTEELLAKPGNGRPTLPSTEDASDLGPLQAMYWILVAEHARRRGWSDESQEAAQKCQDPALSVMWQKWIARVKGQ